MPSTPKDDNTIRTEYETIMLGAPDRERLIGRIFLDLLLEVRRNAQRFRSAATGAPVVPAVHEHCTRCGGGSVVYVLEPDALCAACVKERFY